MARQLDTVTLKQAARDYAGFFLMPNTRTRTKKSWATGPERIKQDFFDFDFKDEFDYLVAGIREELGKRARSEFDELAKKHFKPREDKIFEKLLKEKLAITPNGDHIDGQIGIVEIGSRIVGKRAKVVSTRLGDFVLAKNVYWPVYAGEPEERQRSGEGSADALPDDAPASDPWGNPPKAVGANVTNISAEACIASLDAIAARLDEGSTAAEVRGRTGSQPADPDATETGTLLFTLPCSDPAVNAGVDDTDGTCSATFDTVTDDSSADATGTLGYCRVAATGTGADDHIDGNAGVSDEAFLFNTVAIVSGSTVSLTSAVLGQSQGSTAS